MGLDLLDVSKDFFHDLLCKVRSLLDSHGGFQVTIVAKKSADDTELFGIIVEIKSVVLHADVQLGEPLETLALE